MARILIADDQTDTVSVLSAEIEAEGHEVSVALTGIEAYERALATAPDVVFLGPSLAVHDGYETCAMMRADPDVPARVPILMLGSTDLDQRRIERSGASGSFPREHGAAELRELLSTLLSIR